jgi:hypothetical protein
MQEAIVAQRALNLDPLVEKARKEIRSLGMRIVADRRVRFKKSARFRRDAWLGALKIRGNGRFSVAVIAEPAMKPEFYVHTVVPGRSSLDKNIKCPLGSDSTCRLAFQATPGNVEVGVTMRPGRFEREAHILVVQK